MAQQASLYRVEETPENLARVLGEGHEIIICEERHGQGVALRADGSVVSFYKIWDRTLGKSFWEGEDLTRHREVVQEFLELRKERHARTVPEFNRTYYNVVCAFARPATMPPDIYEVQWYTNAGFGYPAFLTRIGWVEKGDKIIGAGFRIVKAEAADCRYEIRRGNGDFWSAHMLFEGHSYLVTNGNGEPPQSLPRPTGDLIISSALLDEHLISTALGLRKAVRAPWGATS